MKRHIPNMLTSANLICGCAAIPFAAQGQITLALGLILLGALFDFFDGFAARLLGVCSPIGKELDSLADVVTFGAAPATMLFWLLGQLFADSPCPVHCYFPYLAYLLAAFSALRLAKFNLDSRQSHGFIGLPTPANALFWASLVLTLSDSIALLPLQPTRYLLLVFLGLSCWVMVSSVPMLAFKFKAGERRGNLLRALFLLSVVLLSLVGFLMGWGAVGISASIVVYVLVSILARGKA